ncbi:DUF6096 family protein [Liquorilactobacillus satsumensis]|uniref:Prophage protein n=1 Tax=Liquorilactobacillus satsumensis DSM 16230 = JCM 12392 TaxID=1423801 RepID=A0A0R1UVZ7_9LACO|nr:DUF6096 family protein [Liquorilactobacillus satsumensis]KRL97436.1 prophage protein [Liquorilactobacillus satsumensis DSM 16230 = JCM 12392]MCC7667433.1 hypothetical protein [Liquorilactobacillus satsumensis]
MPVKKATKKFEFGGLQLELKLSGRDVINIEKRLGKSMMSLFMSGDGDMKLPPANEMLIVLQGANQTHGVSENDIITAFEKFFDEGHAPMELFSVLTDLFQESGFFGKKDSVSKTNSKSELEVLDGGVKDPESVL